MFKTILVGVNGTTHDEEALALAHQLAAPSARLIAVAVALTDAHPFPQMHEFDSPLVHDAEVILKRLLNAHEELTSAMATAKSVGAGMRDLAVKHHADLIVLGSSHRGVVGRIFAGHEVSDVVRKAPCAIAITPAGYDGSEPLHKIIVGYDGEPEAEAALSEATQLRETDDDTTITVVDVIEPTYVAGPIGGAYAVSSLDEGYQRVRSQLRELSNREDVKSEIALGAAGKELARAAEEADLLMIGLRRHGFMARVLEGDTARSLLHGLPSPLVIVPQAVAEEPVAT